MSHAEKDTSKYIKLKRRVNKFVSPSLLALSLVACNGANASFHQDIPLGAQSIDHCFLPNDSTPYPIGTNFQNARLTAGYSLQSPVTGETHIFCRYEDHVGTPLTSEFVRNGQGIGFVGLAVTEIPENTHNLEQSSLTSKLPQNSETIVSGESFQRTTDKLIQDGEFVRGPNDKDFDTEEFISSQGGPLASYNEAARGGNKSAAEIIDYVATQHSISPRLLIAILELESGWFSNASAQSNPTNLFNRISMTAAWLADGYYGHKYRDTTDLSFKDGSTSNYTGSDVAHFAVSRYFARSSTETELKNLQDTFVQTYDQLFGQRPIVEDPIPPDITQPPFLLPWAEGEKWHYTGGPHGAWGIATAWGAVDFAPPTLAGCRGASEWVIASAPGTVTFSSDGLVLVDMDGDGHDQTGWVIAYLHMATNERVLLGTDLDTGDRVGHPSCEGGVADGDHVHFTRRFNGEWLPADGGPAPMILSGWSFASFGSEYDGDMSHPKYGTRMPVAGKRPGESQLDSDNGPIMQAELLQEWKKWTNGRQQSPNQNVESPIFAAIREQSQQPTSTDQIIIQPQTTMPGGLMQTLNNVIANFKKEYDNAASTDDAPSLDEITSDLIEK